ncbi:MAG: DNA repair protein RecN [Spirochaetota bacterium]
MIKILKIQDFALLERVDLEFGKGMTSITGESGSGKSLLLDAISSLLGARCHTQNIRDGAKKYSLQAIIDITGHTAAKKWLQQNGIECEFDEVLLQKELKRDGRSRVQIQGSLVPLSLLREFGNLIAEIHRQNDQLFLLNRDTQLKILDSYAHVETLKKEVADTYITYSTLKKRIRELEQNAVDKRQRIDFLRYQLAEIEEAGLQAGEEEGLLQEERLLTQGEKLAENYACMANLFDNSEDSILKLMAWALHAGDRVAELNPKFQTTAAEMHEVFERLKEISYTITSTEDEIVYSKDRLDIVQKRLADLQRLKKKYGQEIAEILAYEEKIRSELEDLSVSGEQLASLHQELMNIGGHLSELSIKLSRKRREAALKLETRLTKVFSELGMSGAKLQIALSWESSEDGDVIDSGKKYYVNENGLDHAEFYFTANTGEKPRPLRKVASGGELSRVMLAIKSVTDAGKNRKFMVFDEIDTGIGGETGNHLGEKLTHLAKNNQILLITHLQQIAARSDAHIKVDKRVSAKRTVSQAIPLNREKRAEELAKMISGAKFTKGALEHAKELLVKKVS